MHLTPGDLNVLIVEAEARLATYSAQSRVAEDPRETIQQLWNMCESVNELYRERDRLAKRHMPTRSIN